MAEGGKVHQVRPSLKVRDFSRLPFSSHLKSPFLEGYLLENLHPMSPKDFPPSPLDMSNQQYCLKWNNHQVNMLKAFDRLLQSESFTDVTLACEGRSLRAHKVVLSACSSYFETLFEEHPDKSPIIILKDMKFSHVSQLVNFMYRGEINITQDMLSGLLRTAETLKIKGLAEVSGEQQQNAVNASNATNQTATTPTTATATPIVQNPFAQLQTHFRIAGGGLPRLVTSGSSVLTAALNAPVNNSLAPLAALLNNGVNFHNEQQRMSGHKRMSIDDDSSDNQMLTLENPAKLLRQEINNISSHNSTSPPIFSQAPPLSIVSGQIPFGTAGSPFTLNHFLSNTPKQETPPKLGRKPREKQEMVVSMQDGVQPVLTPIPNELTVNAQQELPDFLKAFPVFRLNDYLGFRTRQQFWEEPAVRRIMEGIKSKEIDMKSAAEILGVSYGTLYGRYREVFGYLKHAWVNTKSAKSPSASKEKNIWEESRAQDLIQRVLMKELSLTAAAVRLGIDYNTFFAHVTDNGKNLERVALLTGSTDDGEFPHIPADLTFNSGVSSHTHLNDAEGSPGEGRVQDVKEEYDASGVYDFSMTEEGEESEADPLESDSPIECGGTNINGDVQGDEMNDQIVDVAGDNDDNHMEELKEVEGESESEDPPREMPRLMPIQQETVN